MLTADYATPPPTGWSVQREVEEYYAPPTTADQNISTMIDDIAAFREGRDAIPGAPLGMTVTPEGGAYRYSSTKQIPVIDFDSTYARPTPKRRYAARSRT